MAAIEKPKKQNPYKKFDRINGDHPLKKAVPSGYVDYPARIRAGGKLVYFNFDLAKEMGLIPKSHENELNKQLEKKFLETFSLQIINEYDQMKNRVFPNSQMKDGTYMATRYLQLQHEDKKGRTSGDGRSIWNGQIASGGKTWDISSCGTGGTRLSPATSKYNKFFETGDPSISYGCGYAEIDEGFATAVFSNIFHKNGFATERCLGVIEFDKNLSINIRAHQCLVRPSHIFLYLKQDDLSNLCSIVDYYIESQREVIGWEKCPKGKTKYDFLINKFCKTYAKLAADFEDEYVFCWLDWDGDNILMDGGIIDYGSVRQFGLCHSEYRYDDVDRFSTSLFEQKGKAKYIVQTLLQAVEFIKTKEKTNIQEFTNHEVMDLFEEEYELTKNMNLLTKVGLSERRAKQILKRHKNSVEEFRKIFQYFEVAKTHRGEIKVSDGKTWDAIFSMKNFLREYPQIYSMRGEKLSPEEVLELLATDLADPEDLELTPYRKQKLNEFQDKYLDLIQLVSKIFQEDSDDTLLEIIRRALVVNKADRTTGDAITFIVNLILSNRKGLSPSQIHELIRDIADYQNLDPSKQVKINKKIPKGVLSQAIEIFKEHREGI